MFGIIFDTGVNKVSDALALALLYTSKEVKLIAVSVSASNIRAAGFCELVGRFYAGNVNGSFGGAPRTLPVGLSLDGKLTADSPLFTVPLSTRENPFAKLNDTADPVAVMRNAMTTQPDGNAIVIASGPLTTLARLLALRESRETIVAKVKLLVLAVGAYPDGSELYAAADVAAMRKVLSDWPTPIIACGSEIGEALPFPGAHIDTDFAWSPAHPVVDAYRAMHAMPYDAPTQSLAAAFFATHPVEGDFRFSDPGTISVNDAGRTKFTPAADGKHRYLVAIPNRREQIIQTFTELVSAKPLPPPVRRRPAP